MHEATTLANPQAFDRWKRASPGRFSKLPTNGVSSRPQLILTRSRLWRFSVQRMV